MQDRFRFALLQLCLFGYCACAAPSARPNLSSQLPPAQPEPEPATVQTPPVAGLRPETRDGQQVLVHAKLGFWFGAPPEAYTRDPGTEELWRRPRPKGEPAEEITAFRDPEGHVLLVMSVRLRDQPGQSTAMLTASLERLHRARFGSDAQAREDWIDRARHQSFFVKSDEPPRIHNGRLLPSGDDVYWVQLSSMGAFSEELLQIVHSLELPAPPPAPREALEAFIASVGAGRWNWENDAACKNDGQRFAFSEDRTQLELLHDKEVSLFDGSKAARVRYRVLAWEPQRVRMAIEGETRLDRHGKPMIWDLLMSEDQSFMCWVGNDWPPAACTGKLLRCPQ